mmetsp:Transcript_661/g.1943  ORF Transcript_661/g.1943 Transcript_661/m.1943 type:complete len:227 (+) Transcript_661:987-1667(+)
MSHEVLRRALRLLGELRIVLQADRQLRCAIQVTETEGRRKCRQYEVDVAARRNDCLARGRRCCKGRQRLSLLHHLHEQRRVARLCRLAQRVDAIQGQEIRSARHGIPQRVVRHVDPGRHTSGDLCGRRVVAAGGRRQCIRVEALLQLLERLVQHLLVNLELPRHAHQLEVVRLADGGRLRREARERALVCGRVVAAGCRLRSRGRRIAIRRPRRYTRAMAVIYACV